MADPSTPPEPSPPPTGAVRDGAAVAWLQLIDHLACGIALYDADDRLVVCNADFRRLYGPIAEELVPGIRFEDILRRALACGLVPEAVGREPAWIEGRLEAHREPGAPMLRRLRDGRWRRIVETRLPDGGLLAFSVDVSDVMQTSEQLDLALRAARLAGERLEDAVSALPAGFELWDADDRLVVCNAQLRQMYPSIADLLVPGATWESLVRANHARGGLAVSAAELDRYIAQRRSVRRAGSVFAEHGTGEGRWIRTVEQPTRDGGLVGIRVDITELRTQRAAAEAARATAEATQQRLSDAIEALPEGFALFDADDRLVACNERYRLLYAPSAPAIGLGARFEDMLRYGIAHGQYPQARADPEGWLAARLERHRHPGGPELQELPGNRWLRIDERPTRDGGVAGVRTDITELVRREQQLVELNAELDRARAELERLSQTDPLTGIANRRKFDRLLADECARVQRHGGPLALLLIDVDHFKLYNDHYGHPAGDDCLRRVATLLADCVRRPTDLVARYGGEEFALLLPHTSADAAMRLAERCLAAIDDAALPHAASPGPAQVTISLGGSVLTATRADAAEALLRAADRSLYDAKAAGRHRLSFAQVS